MADHTQVLLTCEKCTFVIDRSPVVDCWHNKLNRNGTKQFCPLLRCAGCQKVILKNNAVNQRFIEVG